MENSKYHYIETLKKMVIDRSEQEIIPVIPNEEMVAMLGIAPGKPVLEKISRGFLQDERVFEYRRNTFKSDDYKFTLVARHRHKKATAKVANHVENGHLSVPSGTASFYFIIAFSASPISARLRTVFTPAASSAANFSSAVPLPPAMMAPAWPIRLPFGAVTPAI